MKYDCSKTVDYFVVRGRLCNSRNHRSCPLRDENNGRGLDCRLFEIYYPNEAAAALQKWANKHPLITNFNILQMCFPNIKIGLSPCPGYHENDCKRYKNCTQCKNEYWYSGYRGMNEIKDIAMEIYKEEVEQDEKI